MGQAEELRRVRKAIGEVVVEFCQHHRRFHLDDLERYVGSRVSITPGSPGRILRDLRKQGKIDYVNIDRSQSLYEVQRVN